MPPDTFNLSKMRENIQAFELFIQLITMFDVSVDEYIFPNKEVKKSSVRRRIDAQLDNLDDKNCP